MQRNEGSFNMTRCLQSVVGLSSLACVYFLILNLAQFHIFSHLVEALNGLALTYIPSAISETPFCNNQVHDTILEM